MEEETGGVMSWLARDKKCREGQTRAVGNGVWAAIGRGSSGTGGQMQAGARPEAEARVA